MIRWSSGFLRCFLLVVGFLLLTTPHLPAPIQEVSESPTPTPTVTPSPSFSASTVVAAPSSPPFAAAPESAATKAWQGEAFPETRTRLLTIQNISGWDAEKFRYAINEMYARGGYDFRSPEIKQVFLRFQWYRERLVNGRTQDEAFFHLSAVERTNLELLQNTRREKH